LGELSTPELPSRIGWLLEGIALQGVKTEKKYSYSNRFAARAVIAEGEPKQMARGVHGCT
jgi:hypothetical protein